MMGENVLADYTMLLDIDHIAMQELFGTNDAYIRKVEDEFSVSVINRDGAVKISGEKANVKKVYRLLQELLSISKKGMEIEEQNVNYAVMMSKAEEDDGLLSMDEDYICHTISGKAVQPKTLGQKKYVKAMCDHMIVFGLGPAGTGKTFLAMAMAITAFKNNEVGRIILTRPAIEAGEKLGFLPGDLQSKVDPYLRPLYDALYEILGAESFLKNMEKGLIEVAPLAYMRGRTLDNAYIVLDEAQNTTPAQMKMFLTRIGFGSKAIITGDLSQKDLPKDAQSGLEVAVKVLNKIDDISIVNFTSEDVVRHPLVQKIVNAYEAYESKTAKYKKNDNKKEYRNNKTNQK